MHPTPRGPRRISVRIRARLYATALVLLFFALGNAACGFRSDVFLLSIACLPLLGIPVWMISIPLIHDAIEASAAADAASGRAAKVVAASAGPGPPDDATADRTRSGRTTWDSRTLRLMDWGEVAELSAGPPSIATAAPRPWDDVRNAPLRASGRTVPIGL